LRRDLGKGIFEAFGLSFFVIWVGSGADLLNLFSDLIFSKVIKNWGFLGVKLGVELLLIFTFESTSSVGNNLVTFGDENFQFVTDHLSHVVAHPEIILSTLNKVILGLDDSLEVSNFSVPFLADGTSLSGHG